MKPSLKWQKKCIDSGLSLPSMNFSLPGILDFDGRIARTGKLTVPFLSCPNAVTKLVLSYRVTYAHISHFFSKDELIIKKCELIE